MTSYAFLNTTGKLSPVHKLQVAAMAVALYERGNGKRMKVKTDCYEGVIVDTGRYEFVGSGLAGRRFEAEIDAREGSSKLVLLVNSPSKNALN